MEQISPILNLPTEIFLHICDYLDAKFLAQSVRLVCKKFYSILGDQSVWKRRISKSIKNNFPPLPVNEVEFDWLKSCCFIEYEYVFWKNYELQKYTEHIHKSDVYSVLLSNYGNLCITGSSDKSISLWDIKRYPEPDVAHSYHKIDAHEGSVLGLLCKKNKLLSCSWDNTVKYWDISVGMQEVDSADCRAPVRCITTTDESSLLAAGMVRGEMLIFDVRTKLKPYKNYISRKSTVTTMSMYGNTLLSANEAGFITAWDMRTDKILTKINIKKQTGGYINCFSYSDYVLYAADCEGYLHLIQPSEVKHVHVKKYKLNHFFEVYSLKFTGGCIIAVCEDMFCVMTLTSPPELITDLGIPNKSGNFDYMNGILATGYKDGYLNFMIPTN